MQRGQENCIDFQALEMRVMMATTPVTLLFQDGSNGYLGTQDTQLRSDAATTSFDSATRLVIDLDDSSASGSQPSQGLIRFDQIFGSAANQVPAGATITSATLTIRTGSADGDSSSSTSSLYRMIADWSESSTWNSLSGGITANGTEAASVADGTIKPSTIGSPVSFNVTATVQAWASNPSTNRGWALISGGTNGWRINSSESTTVESRPSLSITYTIDGEPPPPGENQAPDVSAGPDRTITIDSAAFLDGDLVDDGQPEPADVLWSKFSGPGTVTFGSSTSVDTSATFSQVGTYVLRLTTSDGEFTDADDVRVVVNSVPPPPPPPTSNQTLNSLKLNTNTGEKPQSKVWKHDGSWFGVFSTSSGTAVFKLVGTTWNSVLQLSSSSSTHADVRPDGNLAHALLYNGSTSQLASIEYVNGQYQLWSARPTLTTVSLGSGTETAAIDIDGAGRMWVAYESGNSIQVRYSDGPYGSWSLPITLATGVDGDDIADITAFPDGSVGVLWSNQETERFGFRKHAAGANPSTWSTAEVPASQSAQSGGAGMADDHINLAVSSNGTLYAAIKTGYDTSSRPCIGLLVRRPNGTWDDLYEVDNIGTRGVVVLNEVANSLIVAYTSHNGNGNILYKRSPLGTIDFGSRTTLISGSLNNVSTSRQIASGDAVFVAATSGNNMAGLRFAWPATSGATFASTAFSTTSKTISLFDNEPSQDDALVSELVSL
jgi:hypothetical protein